MTCSNHTCLAAINRDDPNGKCAGTCDSSGTCKSKKGQTCNATQAGCIAGSTCAADGYCCVQNCGTDMTCRGTCANQADGLCQYPSGSCGTQMCAGNDFVDRGTCTQGSCVAPAKRACSNALICAANACKTSCGSDNDCVSGYYCSGGRCMTKKPAGTICTAANECSSGSCGGRCCPSSAACKCSQPSTANLIKNPGFDTGVSNWAVLTGDSLSWSNGSGDDAESCPFSGSAKAVTNTAGFPAYQCVPLTGGVQYNFGLRARYPVGCRIMAHDGPTCGGNDLGVQFDQNLWLNTEWSDDLSSSVTMPVGAMSASVSCFSSLDPPAPFWIDMVYLTPMPGRY